MWVAAWVPHEGINGESREMLCKTITGFSSGLARVPNVATANETGSEGYYFLKLRLQRSKPEYFTKP